MVSCRDCGCGDQLGIITGLPPFRLSESAVERPRKEVLRPKDPQDDVRSAGLGSEA